MTLRPLMSRTARLGAFLVAMFVAMSACAPRQLAFISEAPVAPATQIAVLQSDVLVINGQGVHLADAITPQPAPDAHCTAEALAARQAAARLKDLSHGVNVATVTPTGARDSSNRPYAHVLLDGEDVAHDLIEEGLAVTPGKPFDWCAPISANIPRAQHIATLSFSGT